MSSYQKLHTYVLFNTIFLLFPQQAIPEGLSTLLTQLHTDHFTTHLGLKTNLTSTACTHNSLLVHLNLNRALIWNDSIQKIIYGQRIHFPIISSDFNCKPPTRTCIRISTHKIGSNNFKYCTTLTSSMLRRRHLNSIVMNYTCTYNIIIHDNQWVIHNHTK